MLNILPVETNQLRNRRKTMRIDAKDVPGRGVDEGWVTCRTHVQSIKTGVLDFF